MHLDDGQLHASLDGELAERDAGQHLAACPDCAARLAALKAQAQRVSGRLAALAPLPHDPHLAARPALARFQARRANRKETSMPNQLFSKRFRPVWAGLTIVAILAIAFSFAPVRAWAGQFLGLFRVQQITVLPIDVTRLSELAGDETLGNRIGQMFSDSLSITRQSNEPQVAADAAEASRLAGFNVRLWSHSPSAPHIIVQDGTAFEFVVDREQAQAILNEAGRSDLQLPTSLDGARISVDIPAGVTTAYGSCPYLGPETQGERQFTSWSQLRTCVMLAQIPSPTVTTPPDLDMAQLAELGLQFLGMTADEARAFSQTVDWATTLVVPLPQNAASVEQVPVDGVTGNLLFRYTDDGVPARYTLLWVKDGIVYALSGFDNPDVGIGIANALK